MKINNKITCVCNNLCKINAPTNPVAPVRSTLPLTNLFLFRFTDLQNERRAISGLKVLNIFEKNVNICITYIILYYIVKSSTI